MLQSTFTARAASLQAPPLPLPPTPLFGTDGIRGKVGDFLTPRLAQHVGFWAGDLLCPPTHRSGAIVLGQDSRSSSPELAAALTAGLTSAGVDVWDLGLCPTPAVAHLTHSTSALGGVMVSASHNPPGDNGIKFFDGSGHKLSVAQQKAIETALRKQTEPTYRGLPGRAFHRPELLTTYASGLAETVMDVDAHPLQGLKIVLDLAWGSAVNLGPSLFRRLGAEVVCLHDQPQGHRINVSCGSTHLPPLQRAVVAARANLGFAFDGDADRVMAVDHQGNPVNGDHMLYLLGRRLRQRGQLPHNLIVGTVMANLAFVQAWQQQGGTLIQTPVGDQAIHQAMQTSGAALGGEPSGHILCSYHGISGDGIATALHLALLVNQAQTPLATLVKQSFRPYPQRLRNVTLTEPHDPRSWKHCAPFTEALNQAKTALGQRGRILVRPSGTEPVLRIMVEAQTALLAEDWANHLAQIATEHIAATQR